MAKTDLPTLEWYVQNVLAPTLESDKSNDWSEELGDMYRIMGAPYCTDLTGHLPGTDHRWQECPTYH